MSLPHSSIAGSFALIGLLCVASIPAASYDDAAKHGGDQKDVPPGRAKAQADSEALLKTLQISCAVSNAQLLISGTVQAKPGAKATEARVYEVACTEGMGYILETQGSDPPLGVSCVHAETARALDVAKGAKPSYFCTLPENKDVYAHVARLIQSGKGATCTVKDLQWFGRSSTTHSEYFEAACKEGTGYLVQTPEPGSQSPTTIMSCVEAAERGIKCRLTDAGPVKAAITLDTFKAALAQNGVACKIDQVKLVGQEEERKRYVVEYRCADQSASMVAFIPLEGNTSSYDAIDCATAVKRGVICSLSK